MMSGNIRGVEVVSQDILMTGNDLPTLTPIDSLNAIPYLFPVWDMIVTEPEHNTSSFRPFLIGDVLQKTLVRGQG